MKWLTVRFLLIASLAALPVCRAGAVDLGSLVSPGPLIAAHEREVEACSDCHESFDQSSQKRLCLKCHEDVALDIRGAEGLHGRLGSERECSTCHSEHQGSDAEIGGLALEIFDHAKTDFTLAGAHKTVNCRACHAQGEAYREALAECAACHTDSDPHDGRLGTNCGDCHSSERWTAITFDHSTTEFPLEALHADAACIACHPASRFEETATDCVSCHRIDDTHRGRLGENCAECHSPRGWTSDGFDHARETRFALAGRHGKLTCQDCHTSDPSKEKLSTECGACHASDDDHHGQRGQLCETCHDTRAWKPARFDHERDGGAPLEGAHKLVSCESCHLDTMKTTTTPTSCADCHTSIDVHQGTLGRKCESCHTQTSFQSRVQFDHDLTGFPLLALHQVVACEDCHETQRYKEAVSTCDTCHASRDVHEGGLGSDCSQCHNPNAWNRWVFDHNEQTEFPLIGGHENLACASCHRSAPKTKGDRYPKLSEECRSCHLSESPHDDAYGRDCERCHVESSWQEIERRPR